jgi:2-desacetyl-2-hydroxyethyl bacteriochlorophyllide A dehydrogenase
MHSPVTGGRAFWIVGPGSGEIRERPLRAPAAGEVLVRTLFSGVSRGTEALVFRGLVPASQYEAMRGPFQEGEFPAPVKYGYAAVGVVESGPPAMVGKPVFALHPHQDRFIVPADAARLLPADVPPRRAVLAANMETAVNGLWDAAPGVGDRIVVVGGGTLGCLVAYLAARFPGTRVQLVDIDPSRKAVAQALGVQSFASPEDAWDEVEVVFHVSGSQDGLATCLRIAAQEATIIEMSWYGARPVSLPLGEDFHARRLVLRSSQVGTIRPERRARWSRPRRLSLALELLADARLDCLVSSEIAFDELPMTMQRLAASPSGAFCHVVRYG